MDLSVAPRFVCDRLEPCCTLYVARFLAKLFVLHLAMALCSNMCGIMFRILICAMRRTCIAALRFARDFVFGTLDVAL